MIAALAQRALVVGLCVGALSACVAENSFRETIGLDKPPPDEFLVMSKAPLVVPPNMNLRPPAPGAPPLSQANPRDLARSSIGAGHTANPNASAGELAIMARANVDPRDAYIREDLLREQGIETLDETVANQVLLSRREGAETLDAANEARRLQNQARNGQITTAQPTAGQPASGEPSGAPTSILLEDILGGN